MLYQHLIQVRTTIENTEYTNKRLVSAVNAAIDIFFIFRTDTSARPTTRVFSFVFFCILCKEKRVNF